jgi:Tol biopolymer transport system component
MLGCFDKLIFLPQQNNRIGTLTIGFLGAVSISEIPISGGLWMNSYLDSKSISLSPNGKYLAFSSTENSNTDIYVAKISNGISFRQTVGQESDRAPEWSPDGRKMVYTSHSTTDMRDVYEVAVNLSTSTAPDSTPRRLTPSSGDYNDPVYSSDGRNIAFFDDDPDPANLGYRVIKIIDYKYANTTSTIRLKDLQLKGGVNLRWGPEKYFLFTACDFDSEGVARIYSVDVNGTILRRYTPAESFSTNSNQSAWFKKIMYINYTPTSYDLYSDSGTGIRRLIYRFSHNDPNPQYARQ